MKESKDQLTSMASVLGVAILLAAAATARGEVRAWQGTITIPTYGWQEDINPKFWAMEGAVKGSTTVRASIVYPYTMQDHLSRTKAERTYKALFLENEYLKVTCLPELGGRLHSVLDKTQDKETFHLNRVIKPGMIAMRGAFISGGVEWNAGPQVHTVTIVSPVSVVIGRSDDGSAYLEIGNLEKSLRTRWTVRVTLHPGKAYLDEQIRLTNPIDAISPYYFWNCTAFPSQRGTRFIYPMTLGTDHHGVEFFSWPIDKGRDLSWLKNYATWGSIFSVNCVYDFFGAYDVDDDRGIVQVANHNQLSGKKAWTWGTWDFGLVSQQNLTDDDGPYIEVQSGPLPTQSDYGMLDPRQTVAWREWWYPVHGLGDGFQFATADLAAQSCRQGDAFELRLIATGRFPRAVCRLSVAGKERLEQRCDLSPMKPCLVRLAPAPEGPVAVTVTTHTGRVLARFTSPLPIPNETPPAPDPLLTKADKDLTPTEMYLRGMRFDRATNRPKAREYYAMALTADPLHRAATRALAVLDLEAGLYARAAQRLTESLAIKPNDDALAWYFLGVCQLRQGDYQAALRCGYRASRCAGANGLGLDLAGRAAMRLGKTDQALALLTQATQVAPKDLVAQDHRLLALYAAGQHDRAWKLARSIRAAHPLRLVPRAVLALRDGASMTRFAQEVHESVGEVEFETLTLCLRVSELGMARHAAALLRAVCIDTVPAADRSPLAYYYLAFFTARAGDEAAATELLSTAATIRRDFVFPSRPKAIDVLTYALNKNPNDAQAHLHLGDLYGNLGRLEEAVTHWQRATQLDPSLSLAARNLGLYYWIKENDPQQAAAWYQKAIAARPSDQTLHRDLAEVLLDQDKRAEAIELLETMPYETIRRADILILLAQAYLDAERYTEAIKLLVATPYFVNWEGSSVTRDIFTKAHLQRGRERFARNDFGAALEDFNAALNYPENLGVGKTNAPEDAPALYWKGKALAALGRADAAQAAWNAAAEGVAGSAQQNRYRKLAREALR